MNGIRQPKICGYLCEHCRNDTGVFDPSGRYRFDPIKQYVGVQNADQFDTVSVGYHDAIPDEHRAFVTVIKRDLMFSLVNSFNASMPLKTNTANGLV